MVRGLDALTSKDRSRLELTARLSATAGVNFRIKLVHTRMLCCLGTKEKDKLICHNISSFIGQPKIREQTLPLNGQRQRRCKAGAQSAHNLLITTKEIRNRFS